MVDWDYYSLSEAARDFWPRVGRGVLPAMRWVGDNIGPLVSPGERPRAQARPTPRGYSTRATLPSPDELLTPVPRRSQPPVAPPRVDTSVGASSVLPQPTLPQRMAEGVREMAARQAEVEREMAARQAAARQAAAEAWLRARGPQATADAAQALAEQALADFRNDPMPTPRLEMGLGGVQRPGGNGYNGMYDRYVAEDGEVSKGGGYQGVTSGVQPPGSYADYRRVSQPDMGYTDAMKGRYDYDTAQKQKADYRQRMENIRQWGRTSQNLEESPDGGLRVRRGGKVAMIGPGEGEMTIQEHARKKRAAQVAAEMGDFETATQLDPGAAKPSSTTVSREQYMDATVSPAVAKRWAMPRKTAEEKAIGWVQDAVGYSPIKTRRDVQHQREAVRRHNYQQRMELVRSRAARAASAREYRLRQRGLA